MPNLSQLKRERMLAFLQKIKDEHRDDDDNLYHTTQKQKRVMMTIISLTP